MWGVLGRRVVLGKPDGTFVRRAATADYSSGISNVRQPPVPDVVRKPRRLPFLKSIYAGQYDVEVLTYPETLNLERHKDLEGRVQLVQHNCSRIDGVRQLGLFGMNVPYPSSGLNLSDTEIARVFEHFGRDTFKTVFEHTLAVAVIKTFGTPSQKSKYLPLLASGAVCSLHTGTARAAPLPDGSWELTASASDSAADAYLLFVVENKAYVVEKHKAAVSGEDVLLERVVVSPDDVLDNVDTTKIMDTGKLYTCSLLASSLKRVFQSTVLSVLPKSRLNLKLREFDSVLKILGNALINIYTIETMVYLTTWMTDGFDDPDIELESAATQLFARQTVSTTLTELKMLNGRSSIEEPFCTLCNDVEDLVESLEGSMKLANFISVRGIDYLKKCDYKENVSFITSMYRNIMMEKYEPSLKYDLKQFLHPALMVMTLTCAIYSKRIKHFVFSILQISLNIVC